MATKVKTLTKQEQRQHLEEFLADSQSDLKKIQEEVQVAREDLRQLKADRDATQRSLADFDRMIRESRAAFERIVERQSSVQAEVNRLSGQLASLGE